MVPTELPTEVPTSNPTTVPSPNPTTEPTATPSMEPTAYPTAPSAAPTLVPSMRPTRALTPDFYQITGGYGSYGKAVSVSEDGRTLAVSATEYAPPSVRNLLYPFTDCLLDKYLFTWIRDLYLDTYLHRATIPGRCASTSSEEGQRLGSSQAPSS